ncbi:hypothetical protein DL98DRAFT_590267 [Cadophora sp. DSE1049]|nr:hypothetical protein DL98DRAFT_590267 [Cadophora sp. DSE1049]
MNLRSKRKASSSLDSEDTNRFTPAINSKRPSRERKKPKFATASFGNDSEDRVYFDVGRSPFIKRKNAFESPMREGQTKVFPLPDTNLKTFSLFEQWVYSQILNLIQTAPNYVRQTEIEGWAENQTLAELWIFGDRYIIPELQNTTIYAIHTIFREVDTMSVEQFNYIYENTHETSLLRKYIVEQCVDVADENVFEDTSKVPPEMLADICRRFAVVRTEGEDRIGLDIEDYFVECKSTIILT